jgi:hypothetical protein
MAEISFVEVDVLWKYCNFGAQQVLGFDLVNDRECQAATVYTTERTGVFSSDPMARIRGNRNSCIFLALSSGRFSK